MKTKLLFALLMYSFWASGQSGAGVGTGAGGRTTPTDTSKITTNVFKMDLTKPSASSVTSTDKTKKRLSIKSRELLQFQLVGGNPLKYKYVLNNKLVNFFEDKTDNPLANIQKVLNQKPVTTGDTAEEIAAADQVEAEKLRAKIKELQASIDSKAKPMTPIQKEEARDSIKIVKGLVDSLKVYKPVALHSFKILANLNQVSDKPANQKEDMENVINAMRHTSNQIDDLKLKVDNFIMVSKSNENLDTAIKDTAAVYLKTFNRLLKDFGNIKSDASRFDDIGAKYQVLETAMKQPIIDVYDDLKCLYAVKFTNFTIPYDFNGKNIDIVQVTLERFEDDNPIALDKHTYNIWVRGGFKIDISGGVFLTSLVNREYYTTDVMATEDGVEVPRKTIREREKGNFEFGFGSTINVSHRSASWINPTLNVGALFTVNQQFQLLTGLGAILGKEERLIFSSGLAMGRVNKISEAFKADGETPYDLGDGVVPTSNQFAFGYYFAITYNFSKNKKEKSE